MLSGAGVTPACRPRGVLRGVPVLGLHRLGLLLFQELLPDHLGTERPRVLDPGPDEERDHAETRPGEHDPDGRPAGALEDVDPAGQPLARTGLAGRPEAKSSPRLTRPPRSIGRACGSRSACSRPSAPTLIISAVPVTPQHMLPLTRNDRPPTILRSTTSSRPDSSRRTRAAASGSKLRRPVPRPLMPKA